MTLSEKVSVPFNLVFCLWCHLTKWAAEYTALALFGNVPGKQCALKTSSLSLISVLHYFFRIFFPILSRSGKFCLFGYLGIIEKKRFFFLSNFTYSDFSLERLAIAIPAWSVPFLTLLQHLLCLRSFVLIYSSFCIPYALLVSLQLWFLFLYCLSYAVFSVTHKWVLA